MKINLDKVQEAKCNKFLSVKESNICAVEILIDYLNNHYNAITKFDVEHSGGENPYFTAFKKEMEIMENDEDFLRINNDCHLDNMKKLDSEIYKNDLYVKTIKPFDKKDGVFSLRTLNYLSYEGFVYDEIKVDPQYYQEETPFGYFEKDFSYLALLENDEIWMSLIPHEINTMKNHIKDAFGNVLVLGLGLGYYVFHIARKKDVDKITIIEKDKRVIKIFKENLLPYFENKDKITIIEDDAIKYLSTPKDYDYCFCDIYHNVEDGLPLYILIKQNEKYHPYTKFSYWIETSLLAMLRRELLTVFEENYYAHYKDNDYLKASNINDKIINALYFATKNTKINNEDDLRNLLTDESLKEIVKKLEIKF